MQSPVKSFLGGALFGVALTILAALLPGTTIAINVTSVPVDNTVGSGGYRMEVVDSEQGARFAVLNTVTGHAVMFDETGQQRSINAAEITS
jgi:hypothetical protein